MGKIECLKCGHEYHTKGNPGTVRDCHKCTRIFDLTDGFELAKEILESYSDKDDD